MKSIIQHCPVKFRQIRESDLPLVIELLQSVSTFHPQPEQYDEIWAEFSRQNNCFALVATLDDVIVGYGSIVIEVKIRGGKAGHIEDIVCAELFRKQGIGKMMLTKLADHAKDEGCYKLSLQCRKSTEQFYKACGYNESGLAMQYFIL